MTTMKAPATAQHPAVPAIPLTTLVQVELRKMVDTRAGRWLLGIVVLAMLAVLIAVVIASRNNSDGTGSTEFGELLALSQLPATLLLPVVGILAATGEFSQRTALTTFSFVPQRGRVIAAKSVAGVALSLAFVVVSLVATAIAMPLLGAVSSDQTSWSFEASTILELAVFQILSVQLGLAFGLALLSSPVAIVTWLILPQIWSGLTFTISGLADVRPWLDTSASWGHLVDPEGTPMTGELWAQVGTSALLWIGLPMAIGIARVMRKEIT